jgi:hypothetical protein
MGEKVSMFVLGVVMPYFSEAFVSAHTVICFSLVRSKYLSEYFCLQILVIYEI